MIATKMNAASTAAALGVTAIASSGVAKMAVQFTEWQPIIITLVPVLTLVGFLGFGISAAIARHKEIKEQKRHNLEMEKKSNK